MADPARRPRYGSAVRVLRDALAASDGPSTIAELLKRAGPPLRTTTQVACALHADVRRGLVLRTGVRGAYRYALTDEGLRVAANPRLLRGRTFRRTHGRRVPCTRVLAEALGHAP